MEEERTLEPGVGMGPDTGLRASCGLRAREELRDGLEATLLAMEDMSIGARVGIGAETGARRGPAGSEAGVGAEGSEAREAVTEGSEAREAVTETGGSSRVGRGGSGTKEGFSGSVR